MNLLDTVRRVRALIEKGGANEHLTEATILCSELLATLARSDATPDGRVGALEVSLGELRARIEKLENRKPVHVPAPRY